MKRVFYPLLLLCILLVATSCESYETYSDMKEKERNAINQFIINNGINVIDEATFKAQGLTTDTTKNQYVRFERNGVYMQICRKGVGSIIEENKNVTLLCRFMEQNIQTGSVVVRNDRSAFMSMSGTTSVDVSQYVDRMNVKRSGTTITASFIDGMMYQYHGSSTVPAGWLVPLNYVGVGFPQNDTDEIAKVKLIVPHSQGTADASSSVIPFYYEITYQRSI